MAQIDAQKAARVLGRPGALKAGKARGEKLNPERRKEIAQNPIAADLLKLFGEAANECPSVSVDPRILEGQPCIGGTRIPVHSILRAVEHYGSLDAAVKCYPQLTLSQVKDALYFAEVVLEPTGGTDKTETTS